MSSSFLAKRLNDEMGKAAHSRVGRLLSLDNLDGVQGRGCMNNAREKMSMTAQEWLDELERLRKAAVPGPWEAWQYNAAFLGKGGQGIVTRISTCPLDPDDDEVIKVADSPDITASDAAYIVAACNAVPMLVEMVKYLSEEASGEVSCSGEWVIRTSEEVLQDAFEMTEPIK